MENIFKTAKEFLLSDSINKKIFKDETESKLNYEFFFIKQASS